MEVTKTDLVRATVVLTSLRRGEYKLTGDEVLAFAQGFTWLTELHDRMKIALEPKPVPPEPVVEPAAKPRRGRVKKEPEL